LTIPSNIADEEVLKDRTWKWLQQNYRAIVKRIPPTSLSRLPSFADCCDAQRIESAEYFFSLPETNYPGTREGLAKVTDSIRDCVRLRQREGVATANCIQELAGARLEPATAPTAPGAAPGR